MRGNLNSKFRLPILAEFPLASERDQAAPSLRKDNDACVRFFALFGSQCRHRIHTSGAVGREETSKQRSAREHQSCGNERQRIGRTDVIQDFGQDAPYSQ